MHNRETSILFFSHLFSSDPRNRPDKVVVQVHDGVRLVSIHSRPEDRLQPVRGTVSWLYARFQSTAGPKTGCNMCGHASQTPLRFVSIHSRSEDRLQRGWPRRSAAARIVSIHSRPEDRLQRWCPAQAAGLRAGFNPQPARRPAATRCPPPGGAVLRVSIHSRPEDRLQLLTWTHNGGPIGFQSTAGPKTGCNNIFGHWLGGRHLFQSTAGPKTGCNPRPRRRTPC